MPCKNIAPNALNWQYCTLKAVLYSKVKPLVELTFEGVDDKIEELVPNIGVHGGRHTDWGLITDCGLWSLVTAPSRVTSM